MKHKFLQFSYFLRLMLFIFHIVMIYMLLDVIMRVGLFGYIFLIIDIIYILKILLEFLSKKERYQKEIYYNIMQIGLFAYIIVLWSKLCFDNIIYTLDFVNYLKNNFIILSILIAFLLLYSTLLINNKKNKDL